MRSDAWPQHCRAALVRSVSAAAAQFPAPGEEAPKRVHDVRKTLKQARAIARLFLHCVGEPARVTITALAATRRQIGRARDLDVMALRVQRLEPPPEVAEPLAAAIARERAAAQRARRGLSASAPRARLNTIVRRVEGWDLSAVGTEDDCRRGRAHLSASAQARPSCFRKRRSDGASCFALPRRRPALPALALVLRLAGGAERTGRGVERLARVARRLQRSPCARDVRGGTRRTAAGGARGAWQPHRGEAEQAHGACQGRVRAPVR